MPTASAGLLADAEQQWQSIPGIDTTDGQHIYLYLEHGIVVGRVGSSEGAAAFAITIDDDGHVATAEWLSLHHGSADNGDIDEAVQLASGTVNATVTITDGDGDTASASADISGKIQFEDDGPHAHSITAGTILDDEAQSLFPPNFGGSGDVSPSVNTVSGGVRRAVQQRRRRHAICHLHAAFRS